LFHEKVNFSPLLSEMIPFGLMVVLLKFLKVLVLGIFVLIAFSVYFVFLIKFKAFHKEDVEILAGGMRRTKSTGKWISFAERILLG